MSSLEVPPPPAPLPPTVIVPFMPRSLCPSIGGSGAGGGGTSGTAAADRDRALHAQVLVPIDRAVDLVGAGLRKRDLQGAAVAGIDRGDLLLDALALDLQRMRSRPVVHALEGVRAALGERDRVRAELVLGLADADRLDYRSARGRGSLSGSCRRSRVVGAAGAAAAARNGGHDDDDGT